MALDSIRTFSKTDLARNTRRVIRAVQRGEAAVIESHGEPEAAIIDIVDFRILRAVMRYHARRPEIDVESGLSDGSMASATDSQGRFDLVLAHYLAGAVSLSRAAEILGLPWLDLRTRFLRLDVPLRSGSADVAEARAEAEAALAWAEPGE
jgi:antitoxin (DNA-binding transcriptional repressor) of toxin-antitoxin stability system